MPVDFARAERALGRSVLRCLSNAMLRTAGGEEVTGMLRDEGREANVGPGVDARSVEFQCATDSLPVLAEGDPVTLVYLGIEYPRRINRLLPEDRHLGLSGVQLSKA